jgi:diguanylate cyclase (GGDEF)-like protein/PAS domain S-box-containing protein
MTTQSTPFSYVHKDDGSADHISTLVKDISERQKSEEKLKLAASVFTHAREGIMITDVAGNIIDVNDTFTDITGFNREEVLGKNPRIFQSGRQSRQFYVQMWKFLLENDYWYGEILNQRKNGQIFTEMLSISAVRDDAGQVSHYVSLFTDITVMKEQQGQLEHIAYYDGLTNLPNRLLLSDRLTQALAHSQRHNSSLAVAFIDLDGFKDVNDIHGHHVGDELLITVSYRMKEALREVDTLARIGGDEFVALLVDLENVDDCEPLLRRLLKAGSDPVIVGENIPLQISVSIGVTLYPQDYCDAGQLINHADQAMYVAKQTGKNRYHFFGAKQDDAMLIQHETVQSISMAIENHEFVLFYQPKVNMSSGEVLGAEALIRWQHPVYGLVLPLEFLPIIDYQPVSIVLEEWIIDTVLTQIAAWQAVGLAIPVSVNISAYQLQQDDFVMRLAELLAAHPEVAPRYLELDLQEASALRDMNQISSIMHRCIELGVRFALDDFGTGFGLLTYLKRLPTNLLKIDQSFVGNMLVDADDFAIVEGVVSLANAFHREVIAEGVETVAHGTSLVKLGCLLAQGYAIARPMPAKDIPDWVATWRPDGAWKLGHHKTDSVSVSGQPHSFFVRNVSFF